MLKPSLIAEMRKRLQEIKTCSCYTCACSTIRSLSGKPQAVLVIHRTGTANFSQIVVFEQPVNLDQWKPS